MPPTVVTDGNMVSAIANSFSAAANIGMAIGVFVAFRQLRLSRKVAQLQFEDSLAKEYRDLISRIPTKALLGSPLTEVQFKAPLTSFTAT